MRLLNFGQPATWHAQSSLLTACLLHGERYFISISNSAQLTRQSLNTVGTHRHGRRSAQAQRALRTLCSTSPRRKHHRLPSARLRTVAITLHTAASVSVNRNTWQNCRHWRGRRRHTYRTFTLAGHAVLDIYLILQFLRKDNVPTPIAVHVKPDGIDLSRYRSVQQHYAASEFVVMTRSGGILYLSGSQLRASVLTQATALTIRKLVWRPKISDAFRRALVLLTYHRPTQHQFYCNCTLRDCYYAWAKGRRIHNHRKRSKRTGAVIDICRKKFGIHPGLRDTVRCCTPATYTRATISGMAKRHLDAHLPVDADTRQVILRRLRVVFTRPATVGRIMDNVRGFMKEYSPGLRRPCS
eukprot:SAG31_NODE_1948_length_6834_cov_16.124276_6_plen_355_part_00